MSKGLAGQAASTGPWTGSCCCSCKPAISVGEARWSGPPQTASVPNSSAPLSQRLLTAPLHCLPVPPDSSATLSPGDSSTSNPARKRQVCRGVVWGVEGSRLEAWMKSQVRGCYNITFYLHTNQPGNCRLSPEMNTREHWPQQQTNNLPLQGHWGKRDAAGDDDDEVMLNVLGCRLPY